MKRILLAWIATIGICYAQTYQESGGLVIMETENTPSPPGLWQLQTSIGGHSGTGYLNFNGNSFQSGPPNSPLEYTFTISQAGLYYLHLHCARVTQVINSETRTDVSNDCYVRVEGDYNAGPNAGNNHGDDAPLAMLMSDTKFFGGDHNAFVWASGNRLDPGGETNKRVAIYDFKAGETYKLVISGRSKAFKLNRIVFRRSLVVTATAEDLSNPESDTVSIGPPCLLIHPPAGRLAVVADGNSPDPDDIGATATIFGILSRTGLTDRLVHLSHSCDLDPFSNPGSQTIDAPNELRRQNKLQALCGEGLGFFGPFPNLVDYYNCRAEQTAAVNNLRDAINASSASDPLWIIEAGEPDIIGYALDAATASKRQYVHVVSHHPANDNSGDFYTWAQILAFGVTEHQIGDQNAGLQTAISPWDWAENHGDPGIAWIWNQLKYAEQDGVVGFQTNKFDCSDAGMVYWWITGANGGGNANSTPADMQAMLLTDPTAPIAHWPLDDGAGSTASDATGNSFDGTFVNGPTWGSDATRASYVSFDGTDDRISTSFCYALTSSDDFTWAWWANQQSTGTVDDGAIMLGNRYPQPGAGGETFEFIKLTPIHGVFADTGPSTAGIERHEYGAIARGTWHHYAMVKTGTSYQWYVDGVAEGSPATINYSEDTPIPFFIGGDDDGSGKPNEHFHGFIDDVVLYRRALTATEVVNVRNGVGAGGTTTGVMSGLEADADVRDDGTIVNLGVDTLVPGRSGPTGGFDRSTVFVFQLPDLGPNPNPFTTATLGFNVESTSASPPGVDLYGLGRRLSPDVLDTDYYGEIASPDPTDAALIQSNILSGITVPGFKNSSAGSALAAYLNTQYDGGNGISSWVFLRLSTTAPVSGLERHFVTSADAAGTNGPRLSYTVRVSDFQSWISMFTFPPGSDLTAAGDPDLDGLSNWFEYLFGLNPSDGGSMSPVTAPYSMNAGTLTYTRGNPALTGVTDYQIWTSEDMVGWDQDTTAMQMTDGEGDVQVVTVTVSAHLLDASSLFVQVRAE